MIGYIQKAIEQAIISGANIPGCKFLGIAEIIEKNGKKFPAVRTAGGDWSQIGLNDRDGVSVFGIVKRTEEETDFERGRGLSYLNLLTYEIDLFIISVDPSRVLSNDLGSAENASIIRRALPRRIGASSDGVLNYGVIKIDSIVTNPVEVLSELYNDTDLIQKVALKSWVNKFNLSITAAGCASLACY